MSDSQPENQRLAVETLSRMERRMDQLVRMILLANAGGVVACVAIAGAAIQGGHALTWVAVSLSLYVLGLVLIGFWVALQVFNEVSTLAKLHPMVDLLARSPIRIPGFGKIALTDVSPASLPGGALILIAALCFIVATAIGIAFAVMI